MATLQSLIAQLHDDLDVLAESVAGRIRSEVPGYRTVPAMDHNPDVRAHLERIIEGLSSRRPPSVDVIAAARTLGAKRAAQGLSLPELVEAYHVAYREVWRRLLRAAGASTPDLRAELSEEVTHIWMWFQRLAAAAAEAHSTSLRFASATRLELRRRLFDALRISDETEGTGAAAGLGFLPSGDFVAICAGRSAQSDRGDLDGVDAALVAAGLSAAALRQGDRIAVIMQDDHAAVLETIHRTAGPVRIGVGLRRAGIVGAALSLRDAEDGVGLAAATDKDISFDADWLAVILHAARARLAPILSSGERVAADHPPLASTVTAFAQSGYSISAAARTLRIHPNTATYRLDRWCAMTGWDIRTPQGLIASTASASGADRTTEDASER
ncbi:PucR family transcriptional regulator [Agromyces sp. SYSU T00266]|uniref:PucR family transcriptional regulator n=1 Tax=Agromyces zhanjiangensis TaxID=3158562 RepID=UPI00339495AD